VFSFGDKKDQGVAQTLVPDRALRKVEELCAIRRTNVTNRASVSTGDHNRIEKGYSFVTAATRGVKFASAASCCWGSMSASGPKRTRAIAVHMSAFRGTADMTVCGCLLSRSLLGVKRTWRFALHMSAYDPKRTSGGLFRCDAKHSSRFAMC
jgi:hypothetical protein